MFTLKMVTVILCAAIALSGSISRGQDQPATSPKPQVKRVPRTPIDRKKAELGENTWNREWTDIVERAIPPVLLSQQVPRDVRHFCPRFYEMTQINQRAFWGYFFQALSGAEAGLNPDVTVRHTEPKLARREAVPINKVRTEGLLQLTYEDHQRYGCPFDEQADRGLPPDDPARTILQPKNNLICGVAILKNQLIDLHRPLLWRNSYWATLRPGTPGYRNFVRQMTNPPAACGLHSAWQPQRAPVERATPQHF